LRTFPRVGKGKIQGKRPASEKARNKSSQAADSEGRKSGHVGSRLASFRLSGTTGIGGERSVLRETRC